MIFEYINPTILEDECASQELFMSPEWQTVTGRGSFYNILCMGLGGRRGVSKQHPHSQGPSFSSLLQVIWVLLIQPCVTVMSRKARGQANGSS